MISKSDLEYGPATIRLPISIGSLVEYHRDIAGCPKLVCLRPQTLQACLEGSLRPFHLAFSDKAIERFGKAILRLGFIRQLQALFRFEAVEQLSDEKLRGQR